jgi:hypothetical protein
MHPNARIVSALALAIAGACSGAIGEDERAGGAAGPGATGAAGEGGGGGPGAGGASGGGAGAGAAGGSAPAATATAPRPVPSCPTPDVGPSPLRRLTREQWANAVRDILALTARPATDGLSPDESVGAFRSNSISAATDLVSTQYMEAAERVVRASAARLEALSPCDRGALGDDRCADLFIDRIGARAYRRPLAADEKTRYRALFAAYKPGGYAEGLRLVAQTLLQSPHFLYHLEFAEAPPAGAQGAVVPLGPYTTASRLSFFIWNSIPDAALLDAAGAGQLATPAGVRAQVDRMLKDGKARDAMQSFHFQWLALDEIATLAKDRMYFPAYSTALRDAMRAETLSFVDGVIRRGDARLDTLLTSAASPIDGPLFELYGAQRPAGFVPGQTVPLDPGQRAGLLTHASLLAVHAHANQTSPVARGVVVRKQFLCQTLPDPPPNVNSTPPDPKPGLTTRERFTQHKKDPTCAACHKLIDDIGFGFERYDALGAYRATENGKPIDASGEIVNTRDLNGRFDGAVDLAKRMARSAEVEECVARQWFRFALGRFETDADKCAFERAWAEFANAGRDVRVLIAAVAMSDAFRLRRR